MLHTLLIKIARPYVRKICTFLDSKVLKKIKLFIQ